MEGGLRLPLLKTLAQSIHRMDAFMTFIDISGDHWLSPVSLRLNRKTVAFKDTGEDRLHRISYKLFYPERNIKNISLTRKCSAERCARGDHYFEGCDNSYAVECMRALKMKPSSVGC